MKGLFLRMFAAILTFSFGVTVGNVFVSKPGQVQPVKVVAPAPIGFIAVEPALPPIPAPPTPTAVASPRENIVLDFDSKRIDPYGAYVLVGSKPKGLREFEAFSIELWWEERTDTAITGDLNFVTSTNDDYQIHEPVFMLVTEKRLFFMTRPTAEGVAYRFDGEFLRRGVIAQAPEGKAVLKGTLFKSKNGRTIVERMVSLKMEIDHC